MKDISGNSQSKFLVGNEFSPSDFNFIDFGKYIQLTSNYGQSASLEIESYYSFINSPKCKIFYECYLIFSFENIKPEHPVCNEDKYILAYIFVKLELDWFRVRPEEQQKLVSSGQVQNYATKKFSLLCYKRKNNSNN